MKKLQSFNFKGKDVLVRCDFNVPFSKEGEVLDDFRIKMALPTLNYLIKEKARVILISHLETKKEKFSLEKILPVLEKNLQKKVKFLVNYLGENNKWLKLNYCNSGC